jgi:hypothetical protein
MIHQYCSWIPKCLQGQWLEQRTQIRNGAKDTKLFSYF